MANQQKRLYRSRSNRIIAGVCGGIAEYFNIDPTIVRVVFAVLVVIYGTGILLYLIMMIIMPLEGKEESQPSLGNRMRGAAEEIKDSAQKFAKDIKKDNAKK